MPITPEIDKLLKRLWHSPKESGQSSALALYYRAKDALPANSRLTQKEVMEWVKGQVVWQLHQPRYTPRQVAAVIPSGPKQIYQIDLIDMTKKLATQGNRYTEFILTAYDTFSKKLMAVPLREKTDARVLRAIKDVCEEMGKPRIIQSDNGSEFKNDAVRAWLSEQGIKPLYSRPGNPRTQGAVERANQTLKRYIYRYLTDYDTKTYIPVLDDIVALYNETPHSITKMAPVDAHRLAKGSPEAEEIRERMKKAAEKRGTPLQKALLDVGDVVRVQLRRDVKLKNVEEMPEKLRHGDQKKGFTVNYSPQWYEVVSIVESTKPYEPIRYKVRPYGQEDEKPETYYREELLLVMDIRERKEPGDNEEYQPPPPRARDQPAPRLRPPRPRNEAEQLEAQNEQLNRGVDNILRERGVEPAPEGGRRPRRPPGEWYKAGGGAGGDKTRPKVIVRGG